MTLWRSLVLQLQISADIHSLTPLSQGCNNKTNLSTPTIYHPMVLVALVQVQPLNTEELPSYDQATTPTSLRL